MLPRARLPTFFVKVPTRLLHAVKRPAETPKVPPVFVLKMTLVCADFAPGSVLTLTRFRVPSSKDSTNFTVARFACSATYASNAGSRFSSLNLFCKFFSATPRFSIAWARSSHNSTIVFPRARISFTFFWALAARRSCSFFKLVFGSFFEPSEVEAEELLLRSSNISNSFFKLVFGSFFEPSEVEAEELLLLRSSIISSSCTSRRRNSSSRTSASDNSRAFRMDACENGTMPASGCATSASRTTDREAAWRSSMCGSWDKGSGLSMKMNLLGSLPTRS
mmetsp:Transcript_74800/g.210900  ORF Transcript_74800/g.210900 Transcript_74800/m.210900 type:complete len:278 (+) Transcript_74800:261-1094(+)